MAHTLKDTFCHKKYRSMLVTGTFTMAVSYLMMLCDSIIAGLVLGTDAVAAVNTVTPLVSIVVFLSSCITSGVATLYSRAIGEADKKRADEIYGLGLIATIMLTVIVPVFLYLIRDPYFSVCVMKGPINDKAVEYFRLLPFCSALILINNYLDQMTYADGDEQLQYASYIGQIGGNAVLSAFLAVRMGMFGIMLGTVIGNLVSILILIVHFFKRSNTLHFVFHFSVKELFRCFRYSVVDAIIQPLWGIADFVLIVLICARFDEDYLVVLAVVISLIELELVFDGVGSAVQPLISIYFGEKNHVLIRRLMLRAQRTSIIEGILATVVMFAGAPLYAKLFGVNDGALLSSTIIAVRIVCFSFTVNSLVALLTSYYVYIDRIGISLMTVCLKDGLMYMLLPAALSFLMGVNGIWTGFALAPVAGLSLSLFILYCRIGRSRFPLYLDWADNRIIVFDSILAKEILPDIAKKVQDDMTSQGYDLKTSLRAALFTEEIGATLIEQNPGKKVFVEYSLLYDPDSVRLIIRDTGVIFDVTDPDLKITGISSFVVSGLLRAQKEKDYIPTTGYNRNIIRFFKSEE